MRSRLHQLNHRVLASGLMLSTFAALAPSAAISSVPSSAEGPSLTVEQAWLQESNPLRRRPDLAATADTALVSSLDGAYRQRWGRQRLLGFGRIDSTHYAAESGLDHESYRVGALAELETVGDLGARLNWGRQREALEGQLRIDPSTGQRRQQMLEQFGGTLQWGVRRRWSMASEWQHEQLQPNSPQVWWPGYEQDTWRLQLRGDVAQTVFWSLGRRHVDGVQKAVDTPSVLIPAVDYRLGVWDLEWSWRRRPGDGITLRGSTGSGERRAQATSVGVDTVLGKAFNAASASAIKSVFVDIRWQPTVPWSVQATVSRDRGQQTQATQTLINGDGLLLQGANDVRQVRLGLQWDLGSRWQLAINRHRMDRLGEQLWLLGTDQLLAPSSPLLRWQDRLDRRSVGLSWQMNRRAMAQCSVRQERRSGRGADDLVGTSDPHTLLWTDRLWRCSLRWQLVEPR